MNKNHLSDYEERPSLIRRVSQQLNERFVYTPVKESKKKKPSRKKKKNNKIDNQTRRLQKVTNCLERDVHNGELYKRAKQNYKDAPDTQIFEEDSQVFEDSQIVEESQEKGLVDASELFKKVLEVEMKLLSLKHYIAENLL